MRTILVVTAVMSLIAVSVQAAPIATDKGTTALLFTFTGLDDMRLGTYSGGVGIRYYLSDGLALRPGVDFSISSSKDKSLDPDFTEAKSSAFEMGLSAAVEKHRSGPVSSVSPYYGAGAGFMVGKAENEPSRLADPPDGTLTKITSDTNALELFVLGGFEWGFAEGMSLGGEYHLGARLSGRKDKEERQGLDTETIVDRKATALGFSTASLFLSVAW